MCRLLGYASRVPTTLAALLGEDDLNGFTDLSVKHGDGWGVARAVEDGVEVEKAPDSARLSADFWRVAHSVPADLAMLHLRWATLGLPVAPHNAHPFTDGRLAFAHNGSVPPPSGIEPLISPGVRPLLGGETDSERLFLVVLSRLLVGSDGEDPIADAYASAVRDVASTLPFSSLNSMLVTSDRLYAVCCHAPGAEEREEEPDYYRLGYRSTAEAVVVSSSGWGSGWTSLANGSMLVVERGTLATTVRPLDPVYAGA